VSGNREMRIGTLAVAESPIANAQPSAANETGLVI
jgi:hypothetical protein